MFECVLKPEIFTFKLNGVALSISEILICFFPPCPDPIVHCSKFLPICIGNHVQNHDQLFSVGMNLLTYLVLVPTALITNFYCKWLTCWVFFFFFLVRLSIMFQGGETYGL